jgi:hypothetical protein
VEGKLGKYNYKESGPDIQHSSILFLDRLHLTIGRKRPKMVE